MENNRIYISQRHSSAETLKACDNTYILISCAIFRLWYLVEFYFSRLTFETDNVSLLIFAAIYVQTRAIRRLFPFNAPRAIQNGPSAIGSESPRTRKILKRRNENCQVSNEESSNHSKHSVPSILSVIKSRMSSRAATDLSWSRKEMAERASS